MASKFLFGVAMVNPLSIQPAAHETRFREVLFGKFKPFVQDYLFFNASVEQPCALNNLAQRLPAIGQFIRPEARVDGGAVITVIRSMDFTETRSDHFPVSTE